MDVSQQKRELLLWYLNYDDIKLSEKEIYNLSISYAIPFQIFVKKLIDRLVTTHNSNKESILDILITDMGLNLDSHAKEYVKKLIDYVEPIKILSKATTPVAELNKKLALFNNLTIFKEKTQTNVHKGQPLPDPNSGRPYIEWKECYHEGCHKTFSTGEKLIEHLKNFQVYTPSYHRIHEIIVWNNKLTIDKIREQNITKCPAFICQYQHMNSTDEVIEHFQKLGIEPIWHKGLDFSVKQNQEVKYNFNPNTKIYDSDNCIICLENKANIIFDKCLHCLMCIDCYSMSCSSQDYSWVSKCPFCKSFYTKVYPY
jgi:hypothetical protein